MKFLVILATYMIFISCLPDDGGEGTTDPEAQGGEGNEGNEDPNADPNAKKDEGDGGAKKESTGEIQVCSNPCLEQDGFAQDSPTTQDEVPVTKIECVHGTEAKPLASQTGEGGDQGGNAGGDQGGEGGEGGEEGGAAAGGLKSRKKRNSNLKKGSSAKGKSKSKSKK